MCCSCSCWCENSLKTQWLNRIPPSLGGELGEGDFCGHQHAGPPSAGQLSPGHPGLPAVQLIDMFWQVLLSTKPATGAACGVDRERGREAARSVRPADVDRICRNKMSPCSSSSLTKFQEGLWHPPSWGERAPPRFSISVSGLPANEGFLRTLIGCLYLCGRPGGARGEGMEWLKPLPAECVSAQAPLLQPLPLPVCRSCPGRGLGKHP